MSISALNQANGRLKRDHVPVRICDIKGRLYLEATLPPAPRSSKPRWHQQQIALKMPIRPDTISVAEKKARQLATELVSDSFDWETWRGRPIVKVSGECKLTQAWIEEMTADYFSRRAETPQSLRTWKDYQAVLDRLPKKQILTADIMLELVRSTQPDTKTRQRVCLVLGMLARFAGIEVDLKPYRGRYGKKFLTPRDLPTDQEIEAALDLITDPAWRWLYGILAAYGIRPHESMLCEIDHFPKLDVLGGKTGARLVYPCPEIWAVQWSLDDMIRPQITGSDNTAIGSRIHHAFKRFEIPFPPSVLRHCFAVRCSRFYTIEEAAKMMGHSSSIHLDTYRYWISDDQLKSAFENTRRQTDNPR
jgi:integrase